MSDLQYKQFDSEARAVDGSRRIKFVISDGSVDRDNDTIDPAGWDLTAFRKNPVVLWAHDHTQPPVAKAVSVGVEGGALVAVAEFATHPFAQEIFDLYVGGFLRATSVGFRALEYTMNAQRGGCDFKRQELLEFSAVPVPANANALVAASAAGLSTKAVQAWARRTLADVKSGRVLSAVNEEHLRAARGHLDDAAGRVDAVLASVSEGGDAAYGLLDLADDDEGPRLEVTDELYGLAMRARMNPAVRAGLVPEPRYVDIDPHVLASTLAETVRTGLRDLVRGEVTRTLDRMRGRIVD